MLYLKDNEYNRFLKKLQNLATGLGPVLALFVLYSKACFNVTDFLLGIKTSFFFP